MEHMADDNKTDSKNLFHNIKNGLVKEKAIKRSEYIFAIIVNLMIIYIVNNLLNWNLSFISSSFSQVLWAINLSIIVTILGNLLFLVYNPSWFRHLMKAIMNIFGLLAVYIFYKVFPLIISQTYIILTIKIVLIIIMVVVTLSIFFEIGKMLIGLIIKKDTQRYSK
jgi:hypothetical protein